MAWHSDTFAGAGQVDRGDTRKIDQAADRHRAAMTKVVDAAKTLAHDRRTTIEQIKDPRMRRSASR